MYLIKSSDKTNLASTYSVPVEGVADMAGLKFGACLGLLVISVIMAGCDNGTSEALTAEVERISVEEVKSLMDNQADVVVVDTRSRQFYDEGHIPGAISMPFPDGIRAGHQELPQDKTIVFY